MSLYDLAIRLLLIFIPLFSLSIDCEAQNRHYELTKKGVVEVIDPIVKTISNENSNYLSIALEENTRLYNCDITNLIVHKDSLNVKSFFASRCKFKIAQFEDSIKLVEIDSSSITNLTMGSRLNLLFRSRDKTAFPIGTVNEIYLINDTIKRLNIFSSNFEKCYMSNCYKIQKLAIKDCRVKTMAIDNIELPDSIDFSETEILEHLSFMNFIPTRKIALLNLYGTNCKNLDIRYTNFRLYFPDNLPYEGKINTYQNLLISFKEKGLDDSYEILDKEFKEFQYLSKGRYVTNWVVKNWWDYGYNKLLILRNALILNCFFFIINFLFFRQILHKGYVLDKFVVVIEKIDEKYKKRFVRLVFKTPYVLLYTCYIFWGLKLDINVINIKKIGIFMWIIIQYVIGIICLAYIANMIITI